MARHEDRYQTELVTLMSEVSAVSDFSHLEKLEDGAAKAAEARMAVKALQKHTQGHDTLNEERSKVEERREKAKERAAKGNAIRRGLENLNKDFITFLSESNHQRRGYLLEKMLRELFELFDLDPRASFRIVGEQIDGAFTFETTDYLFGRKMGSEPDSSRGYGCPRWETIKKARQHPRPISFDKWIYRRWSNHALRWASSDDTDGWCRPDGRTRGENRLGSTAASQTTRSVPNWKHLP